MVGRESNRDYAGMGMNIERTKRKETITKPKEAVSAKEGITMAKKMTRQDPKKAEESIKSIQKFLEENMEVRICLFDE